MEYSSTADCFVNSNIIAKKKIKSKNKKRFSDEQIRCLEVMFESETKLEPNKKVQLAKELGLQPRQVAIWFQNRRARWKSKHIEKEYNLLLSDYNSLASQFESLKKEKQSLLIQLEKLKNHEILMGKSCDDEKENIHDQYSSCQIQETATGNSSSSDGESDYINSKIDFEVNISRRCLEGMVSDDDSMSMKAEILMLGGILDDEENELLKMVEPIAGGGDHRSSLTSSVEDWGSSSLDSDIDLINQPTDHIFQWWDFW